MVYVYIKKSEKLGQSYFQIQEEVTNKFKKIRIINHHKKVSIKKNRNLDKLFSVVQNFSTKL